MGHCDEIATLFGESSGLGEIALIIIDRSLGMPPTFCLRTTIDSLYREHSDINPTAVPFSSVPFRAVSCFRVRLPSPTVSYDSRQNNWRFPREIFDYFFSLAFHS